MGEMLAGSKSDMDWNPNAVLKMSEFFTTKGFRDIVFVSDCVLVHTESLRSLAAKHIQFISRLPETFKLAQELKDLAWQSNNWHDIGTLAEIIVEHMRKTLGGLLTIEDITIKAPERSFVGILGPSVCGKSTMFNIISGLIPPESGRICINGEDVTVCTGHVSYMQQKDLLLPSLDILDNACIPLFLKGIPWKQARAAEHLETFGLIGFDHYYPG